MAQLTLNNQKENGHPHRDSWAWVRQWRRRGPAPITGAKAQVPPAEENNPSKSHNVPFKRVPTTRGDIKALRARAEVLLSKQKVFQTLLDNLQWPNPKNWFNGLNIWVWVMAALGCLLVLILICALRCIWRLFAQDCIWEQQIVGFTGFTTTIVFTNKKGEMLGTALPGFRSCNLPWLRLSERPWDPKPLMRWSLSPWQEQGLCPLYFTLPGPSAWSVSQWWVRFLKGEMT